MARSRPSNGEDLDCYPPDTGCDLAPRCLECPLPACRFDLHSKQARRDLRMITSASLVEAGLTAQQIAAALGCSERTAHRLRARSRERPPLPELRRSD